MNRISLSVIHLQGCKFLIPFLLVIQVFLVSGCEKIFLSDNSYKGDWVFTVITSTYGSMGDLRSQSTNTRNAKITTDGDKNNLVIDFKDGNIITGIVDSDGKMMCISDDGYYTGSAQFEEHCLVNMSMGHFGMSSRSYSTFYGEKSDKTDKLKSAPAAVTDPASSVSLSGARLNGTVKANFIFTDVLFEYGTSTDYDSSVTARINLFSGSKEVQVSYDLSGLTAPGDYHYRVKAVNSMGATSGSDQIFTTGSSSGTIQDIDSNIYKTIQIGTQIWMAENLKATRYSDGTPILLVSSQDTWNVMPETEKAYCYYNNDTANFKIYGALYNWAGALNGAAGSAADPSGIRGACPAGWHVPSEAEWNVLEIFLGGAYAAGPKLTEAGDVHWAGPNSQATNSSGFTALPGGRRVGYPYSFLELNIRANFWTSTLNTTLTYTSVYWRFVNSGGLFSTHTGKNSGFSVRCVKD